MIKLSSSKVNIEKDDKLKGLTIVFTGFRDKDLEKIITNKGGKVGTSVSKNTDIVVTIERYSNSTKELKAESLGIKIMYDDLAVIWIIIAIIIVMYCVIIFITVIITNVNDRNHLQNQNPIIYA